MVNKEDAIKASLAMMLPPLTYSAHASDNDIAEFYLARLKFYYELTQLRKGIAERLTLVFCLDIAKVYWLRNRLAKIDKLKKQILHDEKLRKGWMWRGPYFKQGAARALEIKKDDIGPIF